jgi:acyl-CoA synthetase (AMP-forming)/AMP-acid ligase II
MLLTDFLRKGARLYPDRLFLRFHGRSFTYLDTNERVNRLGHLLRDRFNIRKGDRVAVLSRNHPGFVELYLACGKIGAVTVPLNYRLHANDYKYLLNNSRARLILLEREFLEVFRAIRPDLEHMEELVVLGEAEGGANSYEELLLKSCPDEPQADVGDEDVLIQMYTSGTTGVPKGVPLTHRNLVGTAVGLVIDVGFNVPPCDVLVVAPIFHIGGLITIFSAMIAGMSCNLKREFHPQETLKGMSEEGSTHSFMVPVMIWALLYTPEVEKKDYSRFRRLMYGAAPMPEPLLRRAMEVFQCEFIQGYGLTESTGVLGLLLPEDHKTHATATCREYSMSELRVVDRHGEPVRPGEVGEIVARGDGMMRGYWGMEEETQSAFLNGWLRTGDLATIDEQGYITVVDRLKDMIIKGGENIYPSEVEKVLLTHPAIQQAAVIGVPDEKWGEEVKALVVLKPGQSLTEKEFLRFCRQNLARFKRPTSVEFRQQLPVNPTGKVLKKLLREEFWKGHEKRVH